MKSKWVKKVNLGLNLLKYTLQLKTNLVTFFLLLGLGFLCDVISQGENFMGIYCVAIVSVYLSQLWNAVCISGLAQSSEKKHAILIEIPVLFNFLATTAAYLLLIIIRILPLMTGGRPSRIAILALLYYGAILVCMTIYNVLVFRKPWLGYLFIVMIAILTNAAGAFEWHPESTLIEALSTQVLFDHPIFVAAFGYLIVLGNALLFYALSTLLYKMPLSERIYKLALARAK